MTKIRVVLVDDQVLFRKGVRALLEEQPDFDILGEACLSETQADWYADQCHRVIRALTAEARTWPQVEQIDRAMMLIWDMANEKEIQTAIVRISELENQADHLYSTVIADLFKIDGKHPVEIMKWKVVYDGLEDACDQCKDFTHVLGNVVVKNA